MKNKRRKTYVVCRTEALPMILNDRKGNFSYVARSKPIFYTIDPYTIRLDGICVPYLINAMAHNMISAAFHTIDHTLISKLLSLFGFHGYILNWFKSYLLAPSCRDKCYSFHLLIYTCVCAVPKFCSWSCDLR